MSKNFEADVWKTEFQNGTNAISAHRHGLRDDADYKAADARSRVTRECGKRASDGKAWLILEASGTTESCTFPLRARNIQLFEIRERFIRGGAVTGSVRPTCL